MNIYDEVYKTYQSTQQDKIVELVYDEYDLEAKPKEVKAIEHKK